MTNLRALILALDYGGTKHTAAVLAAGEPEWLAHRRVYSPPGADGDYDRATMVKTARELLARGLSDPSEYERVFGQRPA